MKATKARALLSIILIIGVLGVEDVAASPSAIFEQMSMSVKYEDTRAYLVILDLKKETIQKIFLGRDLQIESFLPGQDEFIVVFSKAKGGGFFICEFKSDTRRVRVLKRRNFSITPRTLSWSVRYPSIIIAGVDWNQKPEKLVVIRYTEGKEEETLLEQPYRSGTRVSLGHEFWYEYPEPTADIIGIFLWPSLEVYDLSGKEGILLRKEILEESLQGLIPAEIWVDSERLVVKGEMQVSF